MTLGPPAPGAAAAGPAAGIPGVADYLTNQGVPASVQPYMLRHPSEYFPPPGPVGGIPEYLIHQGVTNSAVPSTFHSFLAGLGLI
jgi:hypothetical protein